MSRYKELLTAVVEENRKVLEAVSETEIRQLIAEIEQANVIGRGDLLIVNCPVTLVDLNVIKLAKQAGARVCAITAHPEFENAKPPGTTSLSEL